MSSGGGGQTTTTQQTTNEPWAGQTKFLSEIYGEPAPITGLGTKGIPQLPGARQLYASGEFAPPFFPGATYVPFSPESEAALSGMTGRALAGSPVNRAAQGQVGGTLAGDYLAPGNPYIQNVTDAVTSAVRPQVDSAFARGGRYGSGLHAEALGRGITEGVAPYLFSAYESERGRQLGAAQLAPELAAQDYYDLSQLGQVGARREGLSEAQLADAIARYNYEQNRPAQALAQYAAFIGSPIAGMQTTTGAQPFYRQDPLLAGIGALLGGARLGYDIYTGR